MLTYYDLIYIFHFLIIGPLLAYVGYYKEKVDAKILDAVMWLGLFVTVYHLYKFVSIKLIQYNYKTI
jgi:hypothetical protein